MFVPLGVRSDNSLLQSLIKIKDLIPYLKEHTISSCGLLDTKLYGVMEFYFTCKSNAIKPIIGLAISMNHLSIYLYAKNYNGYKHLLKINTILEQREINFMDLKEYASDILCILPLASVELFDEMSSIYENTYIGYASEYEKNNALIVSKHIVCINIIRTFTVEDTKYLSYLAQIGGEEGMKNYENSYFPQSMSKEDEDTTIEVASLLNVDIPTDTRYIPHFDKNIKDSYTYLVQLARKGLEKRLKNNVPREYIDRLKYELDVIHSMGFVDYFLIVYDYVKYAKQNDVLVGPGRGSAAGSLVSYVLGITDIDPIEYNLLFERFLNPERITMPDIDIDFEFTKRNQVIDYVRTRYGKDCVANILTFSNLSSRQVIRDVGKVRKVDTALVDRLSALLDSKVDLKTNYKNPRVQELIQRSMELQEVYKISLKLEGLKRQTSTHAAGVVISSVSLDEVIPISYNEGTVQTGIPMEHLESLGLLKMDFLALRNLTIIKKVQELILENTNESINLNAISFEDQQTLQLFYDVDTTGIFQFESNGMMNFLRKLKVTHFSLLVAALALFRPGPMENIDRFIARKEGKEKVTYPTEALKPVLEDTYGIMIYQEQIMQALAIMGDYSYAEADNIRRAMSKKKKEVMEKEREVFVSRAVKKGYAKEKAEEVYDLIVKFANFGFNKSHSVAYAIIGYQMAYLKSHYPVFFIANLLNMSIGSEVKTREYIDEAKRKNIRVYKPDINKSGLEYVIKENNLLLPFSVIKNIGIEAAKTIVEERDKNGFYQDFFDFVARTYGKSVNKKTIECLIDASAFTSFKKTHATLYENIDSAITYAELRSDLDESLVMKPDYEEKAEYEEAHLMNKELATFGFYVTNHPASKYQGKEIVKLKDMRNFFDKYIKTVVIISYVRKIKTKNNEEMAFVEGTDETTTCDYVLFPKRIHLMDKLKKNALVKITGQVTRRMDKYQIEITNVEEV